MAWDTTLGRVELSEQLWRSGTQSQRPFSEKTGIKHRGTSRRLQRALTDFGSDHAFAEARKKVQEHYGVELPVERIRIVTLHHGQQLAQQTPTPVRTLPPGGAEYIVAEADGMMVPIVDTSSAPAGADRRKHRKLHYQEARLVAAQEHQTVTTKFSATLNDVTETGLRWGQCALSAGWGTQTQIHALGDGAVWIAEQARLQFGPQGRYTVDLYHVCDYFAAAAPDPANTKPFVATLRDWLRANDLAAVFAELRPRAEPPEVPDEQAPVRAAIRYLTNRTEQLDYARALALGLPVGSGLIESGNKHVLQGRLKKAGAWWTEINAHAMAQLRTLRANLGWDSYWGKN